MNIKIWKEEIEANCPNKERVRLDSNKFSINCKLTKQRCNPNNCPITQKYHQPPEEESNSKTTPLSSGGTPISDGKLNSNKKGNQSKGVAYDFKGGVDKIDRQIEAWQLKQDGLKPKDIAIRMGITKQAVSKLLSKFNKNILKGGLTNKGRGVDKNTNLFTKGGLTKIRLHNDFVTISTQEVPKETELKQVKLKHTQYSIHESNQVRIQYFKNKSVIYFKEDIEAKTEEEAKQLADRRIVEYLKLNYSNIEYKQIKRHYGLLGTELAKKYIKEGKHLILLDKNDKKVRQRIDFSNQKPEIDSEHITYAKTDSEKTNAFLYDIIDQPHYLPSQSKHILDTILKVQLEYAHQIELHLEVEKRNLSVADKTLETLKAIQEALKNAKQH